MQSQKFPLCVIQTCSLRIQDGKLIEPVCLANDRSVIYISSEPRQPAGKHWRASFQISSEYMLPASEKVSKSTWICLIQFPFEVHCLLKPVQCKPQTWFGSLLLLHIGAHFCMRRFIETIVQANTTVLFNGCIQILVEPITTCMQCP